MFFEALEAFALVSFFYLFFSFLFSWGVVQKLGVVEGELAREHISRNKDHMWVVNDQLYKPRNGTYHTKSTLLARLIGI